MIMNIYGTLDAVIKGDKITLKWSDVRDDTGKLIRKKATSDGILGYKLKVGSRYIIQCAGLKENIVFPTKFTPSIKNKRCGIMRNLDGVTIFIKGKYAGKKHTEIDYVELKPYLIWLAKNTNNEATVINSLNLLKIITEVVAPKEN